MAGRPETEFIDSAWIKVELIPGRSGAGPRSSQSAAAPTRRRRPTRTDGSGYTERGTATARRRQELGPEPDGAWITHREATAEILAAGDAAVQEGRTELLSDLNIRFHQSVAELSGSSSLAAILRLISGSIERLCFADVQHRAMNSWSEHQPTMDAIDDANLEASAKLMGAHIRRSKRSYFKRFASRAHG